MGLIQAPMQALASMQVLAHTQTVPKCAPVQAPMCVPMLALMPAPMHTKSMHALMQAC